jgi:uncharacterized repeat protein (TIGR03803 family)
LLQATDGKFYGSTRVGGSQKDGTVFRLDTGLHPFAETVPTFGKVGARIKILGNNLTGTTSVSFNGTPATFTVVSPSQIIATVPSAATTGTIQVITPRSTLLSSVPFRIVR